MSKRNPPLASRYRHYPDDCSHNYVREYPTASTTSGYCRGCGVLILDRQAALEGDEG